MHALGNLALVEAALRIASASTFTTNAARRAALD